jgi:ABC-type Fe3+-siderophore transport system permease subunit
MAHHVFPFLVGILLSTFWTFVLGTIEIFDSDMGLAAIYYAFGGLIKESTSTTQAVLIAFLLVSVFQIYLWICAVSLYRDLLEIEQNPQKPTRTTV